MNLQALIQNKHTSGSAIVYAMAAGLGHVGTIWFPEHKIQLEQTVQAVKELCFVYGLIAAGDAAKSEKDVKEVDAKVQETAKAVITGDTTTLEKNAVPTTTPPSDK